MEDLRVVLAVDPEDTELDQEALIHDDLLVSVCAGIVTIDEGSNIIRLVHYTTQAYMESIQARQFPNAQSKIVITCHAYLSFNKI